IFGPVVKSLKLPLIFWLHDAARGVHWTERWASITRPEMAICNSAFTAQTLPALFRGVKAEVIYCPVPPPPTQYTNAERIKIRNETKTRQDSVVIIQVSRMEEWKGHVLLINALGKLRAMPEWTCWIVGGAQRREETRYAQRL